MPRRADGAPRTCVFPQTPDLRLDADDAALVHKVGLCLRLRSSALTSVSAAKGGISIGDMKSLTDVFANLFVRKVPGRFPVDLTKFQDEIQRP